MAVKFLISESGLLEKAEFVIENGVVIPEGVRNIGEGEFCEPVALMDLMIPDNISGIGDRAFGWCESLKEVTIPNSVTHIGDSAFYGCSNLIIYAQSGSYAERYAADNDIKFEVI